MKSPLRFRIRYQVYNLRGLLGHLGLFGSLHPPILLVGSPNSGTRILGEAISAHPQVADHSEARLLWDKDFHAKNNDTLKSAENVRGEDRIRLRGNFCYYQWESGRKVVLNRHPENALRIHFMKEIFPHAKLVHIVRDGRATISSNYRSAKAKEERRSNPFGGYLRPPGWRHRLDRPILEQLAYMWNETVLYASREGKKYGDDFREIRYEDLARNGPEIVADLWSWAGLDVSRDLFANLPRFENRNRWKSELTDAEIGIIEREAAEALRYFGYMGNAARSG